ncbi:MAG: hypothetical protein WAM94_00050 [Chromatiaceae bacterium]
MIRASGVLTAASPKSRAAHSAVCLSSACLKASSPRLAAASVAEAVVLPMRVLATLVKLS